MAINSIKTNKKSNSMFKTCMVSLMAAAGIGFISLPVKANEVIQEGVQTTVQNGEGNTSVQQLHQNAEAQNWRSGYGHDERHDDNNVIKQRSDQFTRQEGYGNTSVQQTNQDAKVRKERSSWRW